LVAVAGVRRVVYLTTAVQEVPAVVLHIMVQVELQQADKGMLVE
jgi:hypothetical protein